MLSFSETETSNAIEKYVCLKIQNGEKNKEEKIVSFCKFMKHKILPSDYDEVKSWPLFQIIVTRLEYGFTFEIKDDFLIMLLVLIAETPGRAILYLWYLQYYCFTNKIKKIDLEYFCDEIFCNGFPTNELLDRIWDEQKVNAEEFGRDNLVDYIEAGKSILTL